MKVAMYFDFQPNGILFHFPTDPYRSELNRLLADCKSRYGGYCTLDITRPYKSRSTGKGSQNNLFWKLVEIIGNETGEDVKEIEADLKEKAISKGYPYKVSKITGKPKPYSMTKINTVEMGYLIDTAYEVISFLGIELEKELQKPDIF